MKISKALSYILRHGAAKEGLKMRPDGFVRVDDIVRLPPGAAGPRLETDMSARFAALGI